MTKQLIVAISRECGSGGAEIAAALADRLQLPLYERNMLQCIVDRHGMDVGKFSQYDEKPRNVFTSRNVKGYINAPEEQIARMQFQFLEQQASEGKSFVVLGRCADEVLKDYAGLISIFVWSELPFKKERIMQRDGLTEDVALELIERTDRRRKYYHNQYCRGKWGDTQNYDLTINSSKFGITKTVDLLMQFIHIQMTGMN